MNKKLNKYEEEMERREKEYARLTLEGYKRDGIVPITSEEPKKDFHGDGDHPNTLENDEATILWLVVMVVGSIFKGNWIIWIVATFIWYRHITRHKRK